MGIYMGGDRDDANNYSSNDWLGVKNPLDDLKQIQNLRKGVHIPWEFDPEYYFSNMKKFHKSCPDHWEWSKFYTYSAAVYAFYKQVAAKFYAEFPPKDEKTLPQFLDLQIRPENLDSLAQSVKKAESELCMQFSKLKTNRTLSGKINKNAPLRHLVNHALTAWIMYISLKQNIYVDDAVRFKSAYEKFNFNNDLDVLKAYRGCKIMQYYTGKIVSPNAFAKKFNVNDSFYSTENCVKIYNKILQSVNGFCTYDYEAILSDISNSVNQLKSQENYAQIIEIYDDFEYINYLTNKIISLANYNQSRGFEFADKGEEFSLQAQGYINLISKILTTQQDPLITRDLKRLKILLEQSINYAISTYSQIDN